MGPISRAFFAREVGNLAWVVEERLFHRRDNSFFNLGFSPSAFSAVTSAVMNHV
jgi:hypothetical protein